MGHFSYSIIQQTLKQKLEKKKEEAEQVKQELEQELEQQKIRADKLEERERQKSIQLEEALRRIAELEKR